MSTLKKIVEKKKSEKYAWPKGWMTREQAANDLGVAPRDVDDTLKEAIQDKDVLKQHFPVWDASQGRVVRLPGYRVAKGGDTEVVEKSISEPAEKETRKRRTKEERILNAISRYPDLSDYAISRKLNKISAAEVAVVRQSLT